MFPDDFYWHVHSEIRKIHTAVHDFPDVIGELDAADLAERFDEALMRIENGRVNEMMHYEVMGKFPTAYSRFSRSLSANYRYVSLQTPGN